MYKDVHKTGHEAVHRKRGRCLLGVDICHEIFLPRQTFILGYYRTRKSRRGLLLSTVIRHDWTAKIKIPFKNDPLVGIETGTVDGRCGTTSESVWDPWSFLFIPSVYKRMTPNYPISEQLALSPLKPLGF